MQQTFGQADGEVRYDQTTGQTWIAQGGRWMAMQGQDMGDLVEASALDGELVEASALDGMGHLLPANTDRRAVTQGRYTGTGYTDNYHAAYAAR